MKDNLFLKRIEALGSGAKKKIEKCLGSVIDSGHDFVEKFKSSTNKTRLKVIKQVGAGVLSVLLLCGFTGCVDENGDISANATTVSRVDVTTIYNEPTTPPVVTTPSTPAVTTGPTTGTNPPEVTTPGTTEPTTPPVEEPGTTTPGTTEPITPPVEVPGTTTPGETEPSNPPAETETPNLPADEDGYEYPEYFENLANEMIRARGVFSSHRYEDELKATDAEVVFVGTGKSIDSDTPIIIYTRHKLENGKTYYGRFAFSVASKDYRRLNWTYLYNSYEAYVSAMENALKNKQELVEAKLSLLEDQTDIINSGLTENFAKFVDEKFVDVEINFVRNVLPKNELAFSEISGFGYDEDGKSYSFVIELTFSGTYFPNIDKLIDDVNKGDRTREDMLKFESTVKAIDSVYQKQEEAQNQ